MNKIAVRKSDKRILSFGGEDMTRFSPEEFDIIETVLEELPDELRFCKYENGEIVVDEMLKREILQEEAEEEEKNLKAREYIKNNNPADVKSVPALIERVKRLEILLGIYKWLQ